MIWVTPLSGLEEILRETGARHVITLLARDAENRRPAHLDPHLCLTLAVHDIAGEMEGLIAPSARHVETLLEYGRRWDRTSPVVVHCFAGISRSTAAAYVLAAALQPQRDEEELALELRRLSPSATPNPLIIAHADALLGRGGRMVGAIRAIGRGAEASEGTPFRLPLSLQG